jgi:hypothetical protein
MAEQRKLDGGAKNGMLLAGGAAAVAAAGIISFGY